MDDEEQLDTAARRLVGDALGALGDRWSLLVVAALLDGPLRYGELQERAEGIAPNILSARLKRLDELGVVVAQPYSRRPQRFLYALTDAGRELAAPLRLLAGWAARHVADAEQEPPRHAPCGTLLETRWYCPSCREAVADAAATGSADEGLWFA